jgi:type VI secretion system protein ImpH
MKREEFYAELERAPFSFDFFHAVRTIENLNRDKPRIGTAARPQDEPIRFSQEPSMSFAPAALSAFNPADRGGTPRLQQRFFGVLGPNGALPLHLTEFARERLLHNADPTFTRFLDLFHHRFLALFYRAWSQANPATSFDRPKEDRFADYVGSLLGIGAPSLRDRDAAGDHVKLYFSGWMSRQVRNSDGLKSILSGYFQLPVEVESFVGHWMFLPDSQRTRLGIRGPGIQLGIGAVIGSRVWDRQHKLRVHFGPLKLADYEAMLPSGRSLDAVAALLRQYLCHEFDWDVRLSLEASDVPQARLGQYGRLGWTTWIGRYQKQTPARDLTLDVERVLARAA